ncbi:uncharacterized protein LOC106158465 [Lingula anatina]|uniref:Uncharacterized protein LOC106158465 n=1 Tax=Lingula anatina TaxID=7574 RepID=A0A1S3HWI8_LINAN|nr:uncharacterized protein LOC106158465 [Lingula anatina]XP_013389917.1 uncharacterized protein LOC106158465 [Lingula anatina]|eukprot:XP_013389916.1 uncharacterized protein LOC106158465 [Lingula anatina]
MPLPIPSDVKKEVRAVLLSKVKGVPLCHFTTDYKTFVGHALNWKALEFNRLTDFLQAMPDVVSLIEEDGRTVVYGKSDGSFMTHTAVKALKRAEKISTENNNKDGSHEPVDADEFPELHPNHQGLFCVTFEKHHTSMPNKEVESKFKSIGEVKDINFGHSRLIFVRYARRADAVKALKTLASTFIGLRPAKEKLSVQGSKGISRDKTGQGSKSEMAGDTARMPTNLFQNYKSEPKGKSQNDIGVSNSAGSSGKYEPKNRAPKMTPGILGAAPLPLGVQYPITNISPPRQPVIEPAFIQYGATSQPSVSYAVGEGLPLGLRIPQQISPRILASPILDLQLQEQMQGALLQGVPGVGYTAPELRTGCETILSNISYKASKENIEALFTGHRLREFKLVEQEPHGGPKKRFAFATFFTEPEAQRAIKDINDRTFIDRQVKLRYKKPDDLPLSIPGQKGEAQIVVANLPESCTEGDIILMTFHKGASNIYMVSELKPIKRYYAIVTVPNAQAAASAIHSLNGTEFKGKILHLDFANKFLKETEITKNAKIQPLFNPQELQNLRMQRSFLENGDILQNEQRDLVQFLHNSHGQLRRQQQQPDVQKSHSNQDKKHQPRKGKFDGKGQSKSLEKGQSKSQEKEQSEPQEKGQSNPQIKGQFKPQEKGQSKPQDKDNQSKNCKQQEQQQKNVKSPPRSGKKDGRKAPQQEHMKGDQHSGRPSQQEDEEWDSAVDNGRSTPALSPMELVPAHEAYGSPVPAAMPVSLKEEREIFKHVAAYLGNTDQLPETIEIFITHTVDKKYFYGFITNIQLKCAEQLHEMNRAIKGIQNKVPVTSSCKEVGVCIDEEWYRAWVVRNDGPNLIVFCCDYGFSHSVLVNQTCQVPDELWEEPAALARAFTWGSGIAPVSGSKVEAEVLRIEEGVPVVSLWE